MNRVLALCFAFLFLLCLGQGTPTAKAGGEDRQGLRCVNDIRDHSGNLAFQNNCDEAVHVLWYVNNQMHGGEWIDPNKTSSTYNQYAKVSAADEPLSYYACPSGWSPVDDYGGFVGMRHAVSWHCHR
jgi:hypothetical protein